MLELASTIIQLPEEATKVLEGKNPVEWMLDEGRKVGFNMLRLFAHGDKSPMQLTPGEYNEDMLKAFDYILDEAGKRGIRLIVSFGNNWGEVDSKAAYAKWADVRGHPDEFFARRDTMEMYEENIKTIVTRRNTLNGLIYRDDPTIFAWNIINEQRCKEPFCESVMIPWVVRMSQFLKGLDQNHLVTTGAEGFYSWGCPLTGDTASNPLPNQHSVGQDFLRDNAPSTIDFAVIHLWPNNWDIPEDPEFPLEWIRQHERDTRAVLKKPLVLEEFGIEAENTDKSRKELRDPVFKDVYKEVMKNIARDGALRAAMFWEWQSNEAVEPSVHGVFRNHSTWAILQEHAQAIAKLNEEASQISGCKPGGDSDVVESSIPNNRYNTTTCCDEDCHAVYADLKGETFQESVTESAGECCRACKFANVRAGYIACTTWSYCPCGSCNDAPQGTCRLKTQPNPFYPASWQIGRSQPWISGTLGDTLPEWRCQPTGKCAFDDKCPNFSKSLKCTDAECGAVQRTLKGEVLSYSTNGNERPFSKKDPPDVTSAAECCQKCRDHPECNGWTYCSRDFGCQIDKVRCDVNKENLGPYDECTGEGKLWPKNTCQLMVVDTNAPQFGQIVDNEAWVSGVLRSEENGRVGK